jgi:hypothetical protein
MKQLGSRHAAREIGTPMKKHDGLLHSQQTAKNLLARRVLGGVVERVHCEGVSSVCAQVLDGALAGDDGLDEEPEHGEHGQAPVLELLHLELSEGVWVVSQAQGVKCLTGVQGVQALPSGSTVHAVALDQAHEQDLQHKGNLQSVCARTIGRKG